LKEEKCREVQTVDRRTWKSEKRKKRKHSEREREREREREKRENPSAGRKGRTTKPGESASLWMIVLDTWTEFVLEEGRKLG
jgi:hypothetical protein